MNSEKDNKDPYDFEKEQVIQKYFKRIYTVLDKSVRNKLLQLDVTTDELKQILKYIGFLSKEKQERYIKELINHKKVSKEE